MDADGIGRIAANTTLAACAGSLSAMVLPLWFGPNKGKYDVGFTINGLLAGLVAITCPCYWVTPGGSILIGLIAGVVVYVATLLLEHFRIDDPVGAVPVHGAAGIWGTISLGLFAAGKYGATGSTGADNSSPVTGVFYGGGWSVFKAQFIGSMVITVATFVVSIIIMLIINKLPYPWKLRVEPEAETCEGGLDFFEHGVSSYND